MERVSVVCRYAGCDEYGNIVHSEHVLETREAWCERGTSCNRPWDLHRDELGLFELKERQWLNTRLLKEWNDWLRSPYCQCTYSSGIPPTTGLCRHCIRPMNLDAAAELDRVSGGFDRRDMDRIRRQRGESTQVMVHENVVRAAELGLKLLINATGPAPQDELPEYGKHDLNALWDQVPECAKDLVRLEIGGSHGGDDGPHTITAMGEAISAPVPLADQPVFPRFSREFDEIRYAWDNLYRRGIDQVNDQAKGWPDSILLYYLHANTEAVMRVLQMHRQEPGVARHWLNPLMRMSLPLEETAYHTDWPSRYIQEN